MSAKKLTTAAATALAAATSLAAPASASTPTPHTFPGMNGKLTVTTGDNQLHFVSAGGVTTETMPSGKVIDAEWAPDGSRVAYLDESGRLVSVRADGSDLIVVATGLNGASHPTWLNGGSFIVYALNGDLYKVPSLGGSAPVKLSASHQPGDKDSAPQGGANGVLVFQRIDAKSHASAIWIYNGYSGTDNGSPIANSGTGSDPSLSPDAKQVVFSKLDGQVPTPATQLYIVNVDGSNLTPLTNDQGSSVKNVRASWSPDGSTIAFNALGNGELMTMQPVAGAKEIGAGQYLGRISWQANGDPSKSPSASNPVNLVERLDGLDRTETAIQISRWSYADAASHPPADKQADMAVIARSDIAADALSGTALARQLKGGKGPLLLTDTGSLDQRTLAEMRRVLKPGSFVYVLGQTQAISAHTFQQIADAGFRPLRIGGRDRFETAVDVAETIVPTYTHDPVTILTATGMNFPDALAAGAVAASRPNTVVVLTNDKAMPQATLNFLNAVSQRTVYGIGWQGVTALQSVHIAATPAGGPAVAGADRFVTASLVAHTFFGGPQVVGIATGYKFPDALAGGVLAGSVGGPLLLTGPTALPTETADYLRNASGSVSDAIMFGGPAVLDDGLKNQVGDLIGQPGQWVYKENDPSAHPGPR
ncbi:cell wall-binding repeat-containing protein [Catenulispora subtropica]|uniref:WD40 domain protein beta Propeller n=1 Tax=Catenulispora subtropica TaxID=450798 RepID=A0ABN2S0X1_9ACTN